MNQTVVLMVIGVVVAAFILRPLIGRNAPRARVKEEDSASRDELAELELDLSMGRISEVEYERWKAQVSSIAPEEAPTQLQRAEELVRRWSGMKRPVCPTCGIRPEPEARYCSNCGIALS